MRTREVDWWTAPPHVPLLYVLRIQLLAAEQHATPFHGASVPDGKNLHVLIIPKCIHRRCNESMEPKISTYLCSM